MLEWMYKKREAITILSAIVGCAIIYIDWKFVEHKYPTKFQWIVSIICVFINLFVMGCIKPENNEKTDKGL